MDNPFHSLQNHTGDPYQNQTKNQRDIQTQSVVSITLGLVAFTSFCVSLIWSIVGLNIL